MRSALFWDITQRTAVISYRRFGTTYRSPLRGSKNPRRKGPKWLSRNVGKDLPLYAALSQRNSDISLLYKRYRGSLPRCNDFGAL